MVEQILSVKSRVICFEEDVVELTAAISSQSKNMEVKCVGLRVNIEYFWFQKYVYICSGLAFDPLVFNPSGIRTNNPSMLTWSEMPDTFKAFLVNYKSTYEAHFLFNENLLQFYLFFAIKHKPQFSFHFCFSISIEIFLKSIPFIIV